MKNINKLATIITRILEITHWVAAALMAAVAICSAVASQWLRHFIDMDALKTEAAISVYGFEVTMVNSNGEVNMTSLLLFAIGAAIVFALMAMVFRNLYLIIKSSIDSTSFQKSNVRKLKDIGIFSIAVPVVGLIMSIIIRLVVGAEATEISINFDGFVMGILVLCLTQFFAHGAELEKDMDGLL